MNLTDYLELELISPEMQRTAFKLIQNEWPQFNPTTQIKPISRAHYNVSLKGEQVEERYTDYPSKGWRAYFWRVAGAIFKRVDWWKRGVETHVSGKRWNIRTLEIKDMGLSQVHPYAPEHRVAIQLRAAYDAHNDILFMYRDIYREQVK